MHFSSDPPRLAASWPSAAINGAINGLIAWSSFKGSATIPLSMDSIGSPGITALGNAATAAFALTLIITCITFFVFRASARKAAQSPSTLRAMPFLPTGLRLAVQNTLLVFGGFVAAAVLWQRMAGTVHASPLAAALVVAAVAALATAIAEWRTRREMLATAGVGR
jgi:hypothetical protein